MPNISIGETFLLNDDKDINITSQYEDIQILYEYKKNDSIYFKFSTKNLVGKILFETFKSFLSKFDYDIDIDDITLEDTTSKWSLSSLSNNNKTFIQLFEEISLKYPDNIAVTYNNTSISYNDLNKNANCVANFLISQKNTNIVALKMNRNIDFIISMIGVMKSGVAYLPIDPNMPKGRIDFMLSDCNTKIILNDIKSVYNLCNNTTNPDVSINLTDLAYVIYTSGTTGHPKGVMIEHKFIGRIANLIDFKTYSRVLQCNAITFDMSIFEICGALSNGSRLVIIDKNDLIEINKLANFLEQNMISIAYIPPSIVNFFAPQKPDIFKGLEYLVAAGEVFTTNAAVSLLKSGCPPKYIINLYGPTETTGATLYYICDVDKVQNSVPIGKPYLDTEVYILSKKMKVLPIGIPGELYIGGICVARGYLNRKDLTEEKFIYHEKFGRLYKTGDLCKWLPNGNIEYIGRKDNQIKLKGYRIELSEIETVLNKNPDIKSGVILFRDNIIVAYIVLKNINTSIESIRNAMKYDLPDYMIPPVIKLLDELPLNDSGKIDRSKLMKIDIESFIPPETPIEKRLAKLWKKILKTDKVSLYDNFFEMGGNSLNGMQLISKINHEFNTEVSLKLIFDGKTLIEISKLLENVLSTNKNVCIIPKVNDQIKIPLTNSQEMMFFLNKFLANNSHIYNICGAFKFDNNIKNAIEKIITRHTNLRTRFVLENNEIYQQIINYNIDDFYEEINDNDVNKYLKNEQNFVFDLTSNSPLLRIKALVNKVIIFNVHHIICDEWSLGIFLKEMKNVSPLNPLPIQFSDYCFWEKKQTIPQENILYWKNMLKDIPLRISLPFDKTIKIRKYSGSNYKFTLEDDLMKKIKNLCAEESTTINIILLTYYFILLFKFCPDDNKIVVGIPISSRKHKELEDLIGLFLDELPICVENNQNISFIDLLRQVNKIFADSSDKIIPFNKLVNELGIERNSNSNPIFQTMFVFNQNITTLIESECTSCKLDLILNVCESQFCFEYSTELFNDTTIMKLANSFIRIIRNSNNTISNIRYISKDELISIEKLSFIENSPTYNTNIITMFEQIVNKFPDKIAITHNNDTITYSNLNKEINKIANTLRTNGIKQNDVIAIKMERSIKLIIAIFGIIKAGAAYLPIEVDSPSNRDIFMLKDSGGRMLETVLSSNNSDDMSNPTIITGLDDLVYIIYTSGSTGNPKGVMIRHRGINNIIKTNFYSFCENDNFAQCHSHIFDTSVFEIFCCLCNGAHMFIMDKTILLSPDSVKTFIKKNNITVFHPPMCVLTACGIRNPHMFDDMNYLLSGGEIFPVDTANRLIGIPKHLINGYGPTEITYTCSMYRITSKVITETVPIGLPFYNTTLYIY